jgi:hypothetical protein
MDKQNLNVIHAASSTITDYGKPKSKQLLTTAARPHLDHFHVRDCQQADTRTDQ